MVERLHNRIWWISSAIWSDFGMFQSITWLSLSFCLHGSDWADQCILLFLRILVLISSSFTWDVFQIWLCIATSDWLWIHILHSHLFWDLCGGAHRCVKVEAREATNEELSSVHTQNHVELMKAVSSKSYGKHRRKALASRYDSIFFNNGSSKSALLAAGSVIEVVIHPCVFWSVLHCFSHLLRLFTVTQSWNWGYCSEIELCSCASKYPQSCELSHFAGCWSGSTREAESRSCNCETTWAPCRGWCSNGLLPL